MKRNRKMINGKKTSQYVFLLPGLLMFSFSVLIPLFNGIHIAFTDWNGITTDYNYVGFKNFISVFRDQRLIDPMINSIKFAVLGTIGNNVIALGTALLVNQKTGKLSNIVRVIFFMPVCFSSILTAFIWNFIYKEVFSQLFQIKSLLGNPEWVIPAIVIMGLWNTCGINMLIYLSGIKNIPVELVEAAKIDGATVFQRFRKVTLPLLAPAFSVCVTLSMTSWLREFAMTLSATRGGPGGASKTMSIYIFENLYTYNKAGYGQAIALLFAVFLILIGNLVASFFRRKEVER